MAFTVQELNNMTNAALDFYVRGNAISQTIQNKPLLKLLDAKKKTFPGGKANISIPVKGDYTTAIAGYSHNDIVSYSNPANMKRVVYPWKEIHAGIAVTFTELKVDGITVTDSTTGKSTSEHSERDMTAISNLLEDKLEDMGEGWARTFNSMLWKDGTQDSKQVPGILSLIIDSPATGTTGGLDRASNTWWRNRAAVGANKITASASNQTLTNYLRNEVRQIRRYKSNPKFGILCGTNFLAALEQEAAGKMQYTQTGLAKSATDLGIASITIKDLGEFIYDPTLDDLGYDKRCYIIEQDSIRLMPMEGEDMKTHNPARPYNVYAMYRAMTWTGGLVAQQLNTCGVYEVA